MASFVVSPPYSIYLNDYTDAPGKMNLSLYVSDLETDNLRVRLRFTIEGNNITIRTKPDYLPAPILLSGGSSEVLDAQELMGYFSTSNLLFEGEGRGQFYTNGKLPEGIYRFCVEAVEVNRGAVVSNKACAMAWVILNDPPIWNFPQQNEVVRATNPQNVMFSWTPRHTGSPNAAFSVEYEVRIVEIWPEGRNANDAINAQAAFHTFKTSQTQFVMGPSEPSMIAGRSYALRIKAVDSYGFDLFKNNGFSEVLRFTFGDPCNPPTDIIESNISQTSAELAWTPSPRNSAFRFEYREVGTAEPYPLSDWYTVVYNSPKATLTTLKPGSKYEYRVSSNCQTLISEPRMADFFSTTSPVNTDFRCNQAFVITVPSLTIPPIRMPTVGEYVNINSLKMKITEVRQEGTDAISGIANLEVPFVNVTIPVEFSNIKLNGSMEALANGQIRFIKNAVLEKIK